jgi:hypothetical protein
MAVTLLLRYKLNFYIPILYPYLTLFEQKTIAIIIIVSEVINFLQLLCSLSGPQFKATRNLVPKHITTRVNYCWLLQYDQQRIGNTSTQH